ncbi:BrnT family toxin [Ectothiorhodospira sp. BSL-9]|uniref:BrnT family toxin n=1 Tax=Ectothiorhodospira sp. BSL-9 TaxID=1442136 RepID=UPI0007B448B6|nr:BrnT family toxin [Ectothiorhodospira sp. BSL-9]ANB01454.1 hypothetical protein ECTOBSL9_0567 [Ectothiorhodospira sp. BSL-9]
MDFEWDEVKSEACFSGRGFDFAYVARAFYDPDRVIQEDARHSYGEERYQLLGKIEQRVFVVIYTPRRGAIRIISARKANQREVNRYENSARED